MLDRAEQDRKTRELSDDFVSKILVYAIMTDQHLTMIICMELTKNWSNMVNFIDHFKEVPFERKIELVEIILKSNYPELFKEYQGTLSQIKQIKDVRNRIAHKIRSYEYDGKKTTFVLSPMIVRAEKNKKGIFIGKGVKKYTVKEMTGLMKMAEQCDSEVRKIVEKIRKLNRF